MLYRTANPMWNPWANDGRLIELYRRRCRQESEEMTCAAQAVDILKNKVVPGDTLLDAGCGGGYYFWSFETRNIPVEYFGLDYTPRMVDLAREEICQKSDLSPQRFILGAIEDLDIQFDHIICFNVLTNSPHYALPLERLLLSTCKYILLRESLGERLTIRYTPDENLDEDKRHIKVYHNTYPIEEVISFMKDHGFAVQSIKDLRTNDEVEMVCNIPHWWKILIGRRCT